MSPAEADTNYDKRNPDVVEVPKPPRGALHPNLTYAVSPRLFHASASFENRKGRESEATAGNARKTTS